MEVATGMVGVGLTALAIALGYIWRASGRLARELKEGMLILQKGQVSMAQGLKLLQEGQERIMEGQKEIARGIGEVAKMVQEVLREGRTKT